MKIDPSKYATKKQGEPPKVSGHYALMVKALQYCEFGDAKTPRLDIYVHVVNVTPRDKSETAVAEDMASRTVPINQWLSDDERNQASIGHLLLACGAPPLVDENARSLAELVTSKNGREIFEKYVVGKPLVADCFASKGKDGQGRLSIKADAWRPSKAPEKLIEQAKANGYEPAESAWMDDDTAGAKRKGGGVKSPLHDDSPPLEAYGDIPENW